MTNTLNNVLDNINDKTVNKFRFEMESEKVIFDLNPTEDTFSEIAFEGVLSFFYVDSERKDNLETKAIDNETLKSIQYYRDGIGEFMSINPNALEEAIEADIPIGNLISIPNFALEMRDSSIFIEAEKIIIDGQSYSV